MLFTFGERDLAVTALVLCGYNVSSVLRNSISMLGIDRGQLY